ncbi:hypothetical protein G3I59_34375 [Amycolatopsis rubida]|uniref:Uncharacterized protein n=1 Tax=Amycolatopsis rubida TaxID=112413 RepID=A0ABX0BZR0_9PSEU|nr:MULTISPECIES: hypothetical protein [Amycolatopsis]MYW95545.1 hypothetical protein [Amycolatopsis rubida]NEC60534.1 hypothetical protein [Amycolatopsis rubida]
MLFGGGQHLETEFVTAIGAVPPALPTLLAAFAAARIPSTRIPAAPSDGDRGQSGALTPKQPGCPPNAE